MRPPRAPLVGALPVVWLGVAGWIYFPTRRELVVELTVSALLGVILIKVIRDARSLRRLRPSLFDRDFDRSEKVSERPSDLIRVERILGWRSYDARDWHRRVVPLLADLISHRLRARYGVDPREDTATARTLLPTQLWEVIDVTGGEDPFASVRTDARLVSTLLAQIEDL